jgi:hypothetical protein
LEGAIGELLVEVRYLRYDKNFKAGLGVGQQGCSSGIRRSFNDFQVPPAL